MPSLKNVNPPNGGEQEEFEDGLVAILHHINNTISSLVGMSKQYTSSPGDVNLLLGEM